MRLPPPGRWGQGSGGRILSRGVLVERESRRLEREQLKLEFELRMKRAELVDQMLQATKDVDLVRKEEEEAVALERELEGLRIDVTDQKDFHPVRSDGSSIPPVTDSLPTFSSEAACVSTSSTFGVLPRPSNQFFNRSNIPLPPPKTHPIASPRNVSFSSVFPAVT